MTGFPVSRVSLAASMLYSNQWRWGGGGGRRLSVDFDYLFYILELIVHGLWSVQLLLDVLLHGVVLLFGVICTQT